MKRAGQLARSLRRYPIRVLTKSGLLTFRSEDLRGADKRLSDILDRGTRSPCVIECQLSDCRWFGPTGIAYGPASLHPYVQSLRQYMKGECTSYRGTALEHYWKSWCPDTLAESLGLELASAHAWLQASPPLSDFMPWGGVDQLKGLKASVQRIRAVGQDNGGPRPHVTTAVRQVGPKPDWFGEVRFKQLTGLFETISAEGYRQDAPVSLPYFQQHIVVDCLVRDEEVRFLVANGQHRASVMSAMMHEHVPVLINVIHKRGPAVIRRDDVTQWPLVEHGLIAAHDALGVFDRVFDGRQPRNFPHLPLARE